MNILSIEILAIWISNQFLKIPMEGFDRITGFQENILFFSDENLVGFRV